MDFDLGYDERDRIKRLLAQRFGRPKSEISPEDFKRASSWKVLSLIAVTFDTGLRPKEVEKAKVSWFDLDNGEMQVPEEEATKNDESWECELSDTATNALFKWLKERETYEKYRGRDEVWLNKRGNPYFRSAEPPPDQAHRGVRDQARVQSSTPRLQYNGKLLLVSNKCLRRNLFSCGFDESFLNRWPTIPPTPPSSRCTGLPAILSLPVTGVMLRKK